MAHTYTLFTGMLDAFRFHVESPPSVVPVTLVPTFGKIVMDPRSCRDRQLHGTMCLRKLLETCAAPIDQIVGIRGFTDRLIVLVVHNVDRPELQFEAARVLTKIAELRPDCVVDNESAVPTLIRHLKSPQNEIKWVAALALGNLAHSSAECCDRIVACGVVEPLCACITSDGANRVMLRWTVPLLVSSLSHHDDEVVTDVLRALCFISKGQHDCIQAVVEQGIVPRVVQLLSASSDAVVTQVVRVLGNVAAGNDAQTQTVINAGALSCFPALLAHPDPVIRKEVLWTCSNITAGNADQIGAFIEAGLVPLIIINTRANELEVKKEAVWTIGNVTSGGNREQIKYLVEAKALEALCDVLGCRDRPVVVVALEALENILFVGADDQAARNLPHNPYVVVWRNIDEGRAKLEELQHHSAADVQHQATSIVERFFMDDGEAKDAPASSHASSLRCEADSPFPPYGADA